MGTVSEVPESERRLTWFRVAVERALILSELEVGGEAKRRGGFDELGWCGALGDGHVRLAGRQEYGERGAGRDDQRAVPLGEAAENHGVVLIRCNEICT